MARRGDRCVPANERRGVRNGIFWRWTLTGGAASDLLVGRAGNDVIMAGAGADLVYGGKGADVLWGQDGDDLIDAGSGNDLVYAARGTTSWSAGPATTRCAAAGDDLMHGGAGDDMMHGGGGSNMLYGGTGDDLLDVRWLTHRDASTPQTIRSRTGATRRRSRSTNMHGGAATTRWRLLRLGPLLGRFGNDRLRGQDGDDLLTAAPATTR